MKNILLKSSMVVLCVALHVNTGICSYKYKKTRNCFGRKTKHAKQERRLAKQLLQQKRKIQEENPTQFYQVKSILEKNPKLLEKLEDNVENSTNVIGIIKAVGCTYAAHALLNMVKGVSSCGYPNICIDNSLCCEPQEKGFFCWLDLDCDRTSQSLNKHSTAYLSLGCDGYCQYGECCANDKDNGQFNIHRCSPHSACQTTISMQYVPSLNQTLPKITIPEDLSAATVICSIAAATGFGALISNPVFWCFACGLGLHQLKKLKKQKLKNIEKSKEENKKKVKKIISPSLEKVINKYLPIESGNKK